MRHPAAIAIGAGLIALAGAHADPAEAQAGPPPQGLSLGIGAGFAPDFVGSDDYLPAPLPAVEYHSARLNLRSNGLGLEVAFLESGGVSVGGIAWLDAGRNDLFDAEDAVVRRLRRINASAELGVFAEAALPYEDLGGGVFVARLSAVRGSSGGHEGQLIEASAGIVRQAGQSWTLGAFGTLSAQNDHYAQAFFGVTAADAAASGLNRFQAGGGLRDIGVSGFASRPLSERLSITATVAYSRLQGDAAESPIVTVRGSRNQMFGGVALTWRFGGGA